MNRVALNISGIFFGFRLCNLSLLRCLDGLDLTEMGLEHHFLFAPELLSWSVSSVMRVVTF